MLPLEAHCSCCTNKQASPSFVSHSLLHAGENPDPQYEQLRQNNSHRRSLRRLLGITRRGRITQTALTARAQPPSVRSHPRQRRRPRMIDESRRTLCMRNSHVAGDKVATPGYAVGMSPNKNISSWTSVLSPGGRCSSSSSTGFFAEEITLAQREGAKRSEKKQQ